MTARRPAAGTVGGQQVNDATLSGGEGRNLAVDGVVE
jgi:hypothetical protein